MRPSFAKVARIATTQHGQITTQQLREAGAGMRRIRRWADDGRLWRQHTGVYAVGHEAPSLLGDLMAAMLAAGTGASISHESVAHLLALGCERPGRIHVTVPTLNGRARPGLVVHRVAALPMLDVAEHHAIRITTVPRTLLDLAPGWPERRLTRAAHEAWVRHGTSPVHVEACIARGPHKPGAAKLRRALGTDATLSALEDGFIALLVRHELAAPRTNIDVAGDKVDCHWPQYGLTIELHGYRFHASRQAFEADLARRRRSRHLAFSWGDVFEREAPTAAEVARALEQSSGEQRPA